MNETRIGPETYAAEAEAHEAAGRWAEAVKAWSNAAGASMGHNRAERYERAAEDAQAKATPDRERYIVDYLGLGCWGIGDTIEEADKRAREEGRLGRRKGMRSVYRFVLGETPRAGITGDGSLCWRGKMPKLLTQTHDFTGRGAKCTYNWPGGEQPSELCGLPRSLHLK